MKLEKRIAETYPTGMLVLLNITMSYPYLLIPDPPIKRFAQRHTYLAIDAIAARDLGVAVARHQGLAISNSSVNVQRQDTVQNLLANSNQSGQNVASSSSASPATKRPVSPDRSHASLTSTNKRQRPFSPPPRDRDRRDGPGPRKRFNSPSRGERGHDPPTGPRARDKDNREDEKQVTLPNVLSWFVGQLPPPAAFDGAFHLMMIYPYIRL
jgi:cleavage stimulation factor subunit 3